MRNGGSPAHRFWTSSLTQRVFLWQHVLEHPPDRNIKVPLARNLPSHSGWNAFWRESLSSFQRKTAQKTLTIEDLPFEIEASGDGAFPSSGGYQLTSLSLVLPRGVGRQFLLPIGVAYPPATYEI